MAATFSFNKTGLGHFAARLLLLPFLVALMSILYSHSSPVQSRIFLQTGGLIFNILTLFYVAGIAATSLLCKYLTKQDVERKGNQVSSNPFFFTEQYPIFL